jgi:hypothetical protein
MNALAFLATVVLALAGLWLAITIADMVRVQECFMTGRRTCAPIDIETGAIKRI